MTTPLKLNANIIEDGTAFILVTNPRVAVDDVVTGVVLEVESDSPQYGSVARRTYSIDLLGQHILRVLNDVRLRRSAFPDTFSKWTRQLAKTFIAETRDRNRFIDEDVEQLIDLLYAGLNTVYFWDRNAFATLHMDQLVAIEAEAFDLEGNYAKRLARMVSMIDEERRSQLGRESSNPRSQF